MLNSNSILEVFFGAGHTSGDHIYPITFTDSNGDYVFDGTYRIPVGTMADINFVVQLDEK